MDKFKGTKGLIIILALILLVVGYYYYLSNRNNTRSEDNVKATPAQEVLLNNYEVNYPPTPKEVVKSYLDITKVLHNEDLTDEEVEAVGLKLEELFDKELAENKTDEDYLKDLKSELTSFKSNDYSIVNYYTSSSTEVDYYTADGFELSRLYGTYNIRTSSGTQILTEVFVLRKDEKGRWKIYGWQPVTTDGEE